jgi:serine/threonine protein kinase
MHEISNTSGTPSFFSQGGNILVSNDGCVKLADFGASKKVEAFGTDPDKVMEDLTVRGTPYFMVRNTMHYTYSFVNSPSEFLTFLVGSRGIPGKIQCQGRRLVRGRRYISNGHRFTTVERARL